MARRTIFCPVSENLSVIEPRSITVFHSNLDTSSNHGLMGRLYRSLRLFLILQLIGLTSAPRLRGRFFLWRRKTSRDLISESLSYRSAIFMSRRLKTGGWRPVVGSWRSVVSFLLIGRQPPTTNHQLLITNHF